MNLQFSRPVPNNLAEIEKLWEKKIHQIFDEFIKANETSLKAKKVESEFLKFYGRTVENEYELFRLIRNDEIVHRNESIEKIKSMRQI